MRIRTVLLILAVVVILGISWWLISPLFITVEVQEPSPVQSPVGFIGDSEASFTKPIASVPRSSQGLLNTSGQKDSTQSVGSPVLVGEKGGVQGEDRKDEMAQTPKSSGTKTLAQGSFVPDAHHGEGNAMILEIGLNKTLRFENFKVDNGPDLRVYLATDAMATEFVDIGALKGTKGNFNMDIKDDVDLTKYRWVLIWCRAFGVLFSHAALG